LEYIDVDDKYINNALVLCSANTHPKVINKLSRNSKLFLFQTNTVIFNDIRYIPGITVGDTGIKLLLSLGVEKIYLLGIDAALNQFTGLSHDTTHKNAVQHILDIQSPLDSDFGKEIFKVKGNLKQEVFTTGNYTMMRESLNTIKSYFTKKTTIYNLSNHGVFIENTIPTFSAAVKLKKKINKKDFHKKMSSSMDNYIKTTYNKTDISHLNICLNFINHYNVVQNNEEGHDLIISKMMQEYNMLILPYYNYILNNYQMKNQIEKIKQDQVKIILNSLKIAINNTQGK
ncbi:hypothetical protein, partial [Poseidonibacter sp.]|uniref:hypothetical protein n=1 Tax=Poseidonibacter sp. TaxID=2321188 RepID=UPI003C774340